MRITGGVHRSRSLKAPRGSSTRPTSDRVREALFAILASAGAIDGARVLDLYAGTGALGLEALSRGAAHATLVERGREALAAIRANVEALREERRTRVLAMPVSRATTALGGDRFDLVFADPPYADVAKGTTRDELAPIVEAHLAPDARVVVEHASADGPPAIDGLATLETRRYGDTSLTFYASEAGAIEAENTDDSPSSAGVDSAHSTPTTDRSLPAGAPAIDDM